MMNLVESEIVTVVFVIYPQYMVCVGAIFFFYCYYFDYFTSSEKQENTVDHDYLVNTTTLDAEEEIAGLEDMVFGFATFFFFFA
jgi:hypothetical protein